MHTRSTLLFALLLAACGTPDGTDDSSDISESGDGLDRVGFYCATDDDCDGGYCEGVMCTAACDGEDFEQAACGEGNICHEGTCHMTCDDYEDCPLESAPDWTGGYMCGGPNSDYSTGIYTCFLHEEDPGG